MLSGQSPPPSSCVTFLEYELFYCDIHGFRGIRQGTRKDFVPVLVGTFIGYMRVFGYLIIIIVNYARHKFIARHTTIPLMPYIKGGITVVQGIDSIPAVYLL